MDLKIKNQNFKHKNLEIVFTVHEEAGLYGAKALDYSMLESKNAIVLDSSGEIGGIILEIRGYVFPLMRFLRFFIDCLETIHTEHFSI